MIFFCLCCSGLIGQIVSLGIVVWCSRSATTMFTTVLDMHDQTLLVLYPNVLVYACFALLTIF